MKPTLEPINALSFSMQANRGVYAVLFGSGLSRSAGIPTGWEITLDLVRKLAAMDGEHDTHDPEGWYIAKFGTAPDYSVLLDALARTPTERRQLVSQYLEPTPEEQEQGVKLPTPAHRAIATLVAKGYIRVLVTTNFDRLMELALQDAGITPSVISNVDQIKGAMPLIHTECCVVKVHGDYLDTRIRNTPEELSEYPPELNAFLDRIFDEFGLITCGWSADWDEALKQAITRAPSRRFSTYWAARGEPSDTARRLVEHRGAQFVPIANADSFFGSLLGQVESLEQFSRPHPMTTAAAVAALKRYTGDPRHIIPYADLVEGEVDRVLDVIHSPEFPVGNCPHPNKTDLNHRVNAFASTMTTLVAMAAESGRWANETQQDVWVRALAKLAAPRSNLNSYFPQWVSVQKLPATMLLYALGITALEWQKYSFVAKLFNVKVHNSRAEKKSAVGVLPGRCILGDAAKDLEGMENRYTPFSDWLFDQLSKPLSKFFPDHESAELAFDRYEFIQGMAFQLSSSKLEGHYWAPTGRFGYNHSNRHAISQSLDFMLTNEGSESTLVKANLFGSSVESCKQQIVSLESFVEGLHWY